MTMRSEDGRATETASLKAPETKADRLMALYNMYLDEYRDRETVMGFGNADASVILIGEAPGRDEVKLSKPFSGAAGKKLDKFLDTIGLDRDTVFITNAIKYRLSCVSPKSGRKKNRPAESREIEANRKYLIKEIDIIKPLITITLGNVPLRAVTGNMKITIGETHGRIISSSDGEGDRNKVCILSDVFPLYHPAGVIYNQSLEKVYLEDLEILKKILALKNIL